ncbi:YaeC family lipoprotein [Dorea sp. 5-2]|nr:YaeC family lipoprotein [Dorea sp. 5-2]
MKNNVRKRLFGALLSAATLSALLMGCQNNSKETNEASSQVSENTQEETKSESKEKVIKIAGTASVSEVFYEAFKEKYEAMGYKTEFIAFDSNPVCLEACASGETDISLGQQKKFVQSYNENNGADLDMVKPYGMFTGIGLYSEKYESIDDIPDGSQIAVMNDATNEDVSLKILETAGLIKLSDDVEFVTVADITENPKNLEIIEMEQAQTVTALDDMAAACCWFTHMSASGKDPSSYLIRDEVMINYPMGVIANAEDAASDWAVAMAECLRDPKVQAAIDEVFPNVFEFYTSDEQVEE